jgi:hypothetical protein
MSKVLVLVIGLISFLQAQTIMWEKMIPFETADDGPVSIDVDLNGDIYVACYTNGPNESAWIEDSDSLIHSPDTKVITLDAYGELLDSENYGDLFKHSVNGIACTDSGFTLLGNHSEAIYVDYFWSYIYPHSSWMVKFSENSRDTISLIVDDGYTYSLKRVKNLFISDPVAIQAGYYYDHSSGGPEENILTDTQSNCIFNPRNLELPDSIFTNPSIHDYQVIIIDDFIYEDNGDLIIAGGIGVGPVLVGFECYYLMKLDSAGQIIWETYSHPGVYEMTKSFCVATAEENSCIACTGIDKNHSGGIQDNEYYIVKYDSTGTPLYSNGSFRKNFNFIYRIGAHEYIANEKYGSNIIKFTDTGSEILIDWQYDFSYLKYVYPLMNGFIAVGVKVNNIWIAKVDTTTGIEDTSIPTSTQLYQNYPNPFNPSTEISYALKSEGMVTLSVFNTKGELVSTLVNGKETAGNHTVNFNGEGLNSGIYFYKLSVDGKAVQSRKMMMLK